MKSESITQITKAIIAVMQSVKNIDKSITVGTGSQSYKGVPDNEVKKVIGDAMAKNGLAILQTSVDAKTNIDRWQEETQYGPKMKQSVFTEVNTKYLLVHDSGEFIELSGYGHGVDSQDKGAGKATTYALKYTLLYSFLVPTGAIDDADSTHSSDIPTPKVKKALITDGQFAKLLARIKDGDKSAGTKAQEIYSFSTEQFAQLKNSMK